MRRVIRLLPVAAAFAVGLVSVSPAPAQSPTELERRVKAAFLYKFIGYVQWPEGTFPRLDSPVVIGVRGDRRLAAELKALVAGRAIDGRPVAVSELDGIEGDPGVHVLFIARSQTPRLESLVHAAPSRGVLIVTESEGALGSGSVINFVLHRGRVRFDISLAEAERRGLVLRSGLLAVAQSVLTAHP